VDEYLEHARIMVFHNNGDQKVFISSSDWMLRNLDHRVEVAVQVTDPGIVAELKGILDIQLNDNVKARKLDNELKNEYVISKGKKIRSQVEIYHYLLQKTLPPGKKLLP
jgi:polyphosphate kinase